MEKAGSHVNQMKCTIAPMVFATVGERMYLGPEQVLGTDMHHTVLYAMMTQFHPLKGLKDRPETRTFSDSLEVHCCHFSTLPLKVTQ